MISLVDKRIDLTYIVVPIGSEMNPCLKITKSIFVLLMACMFVVTVSTSCSNSQKKEDSAIVVSEQSQTNPVKEKSDEESGKTSAPKSDVEQVAQVVNVVVDVSRDLIKRKQIRDSIKMEQREKMFAYQLGFPLNNIEGVFEVFERLDDTENVYVIKRSRRDYYIIHYEGKSEKELKDSLEVFKIELPEDIASATKIINMASLCSRGEKLMKNENLTRKKHDSEVPCLVCENN